MRSSRVFLKCLAVLSIACGALPAAAKPTPARALLALSKTDRTMAIVDPATLEVVARMPVGSDPHEVIASDDGKIGYASITGGGQAHELSIVDLVGQKALASFDTTPFLGPHGLAFVGGKVWFTAEGAKTVARYDPASGRIDWSLGTGQDRTHMIYVTPNQEHLAVTNVSSGTVTIMDHVLLQPPSPPPGAPPPPPSMQKPHWDWAETVIPVAKGAEGFDVSPDGKELWTAASSDGTLWIIDLAARKVAATLDAKVVGANRLKFTPDGKRVLITSLRGGDVVVYDVATRKEAKRIAVGHGSAGLLMDPPGNRAFVACTPDDRVAVVDLGKLEVTGHVDIGGHPDGLAWAVRPENRP
jgi:YVTN family beta-propeller protein